jgi:hypothetical protein
MKRLPHIITDDEFFFATEAQRREWNERMAAGAHADLTQTAPLNLSPSWVPPLVGTWAETWQLWNEQRTRALADDDEADRRRGSWGE